MDPWIFQASLVAQLVKYLPAMRETWVLSLSWADPLEKGKATHSSILALRIPWTIESMGSQRVKTWWSDFNFHFSWIFTFYFGLSSLTCCSLAYIVLVLTRELFQLASVSFDLLLSMWMFLFLSTSLLSHTTRCSRLILYISCLGPAG